MTSLLISFCSSYGVIEALEISVDMKLIEFRSLFERINAQSLHELDNLMKESTDFEYCYKHFVACQGKAVSVCPGYCHLWAVY